jgi:hypothetical protein
MPKLNKRDLGALIVLFLCGLKFTYFLEKEIDVRLMDETVYLYNGIELFKRDYPSVDGSPLYAIWYWLLSLFNKDNLQLYYLNYRITAILPCLLTFIILRQHRVSTLLATLTSFCMMISVANLPIAPKPVHAALIFLLGFWVMANLFDRHKTLSLFILAIGSLFTSYLRPEYFLTFLGFSFLLCAWGVIKKSSKIIPYALVLFTTPIVLHFIYGLAMFDNGNRNAQAIIQNLSYHLTVWNHLNVNPWTNSDTLVKERLGEIHGLWDAFKASPSFFMCHIFDNATHYITALPKLFFIHFSIFLPSDNLQFRRTEGIAFGIFFVWIVLKYKLLRIQNLRETLQENRLLFSYAALCSIPGMLGAVVQLPRYHYLWVQITMAFIVLAIFLQKYVPVFKKEIPNRDLIFLAFLLIALTPRPSAYGQPNLITINALKSISLNQKEVNMLEMDGGYFVYLGENYHWIVLEPSNNLQDFLEKKKVNMIVVSTNLKMDMELYYKDEWTSFLKNYNSFGYQAFNLPAEGRIALIRSDLLSQQ